MRRVAWILLLVYGFTIPWEYSLDLGAPLGNVARITGLILLLVFIPAVLHAGRMRVVGALQWLVLAFYLWSCCSYIWSIDGAATLERMRAYAQVMVVVWLAWELAENTGDLLDLMCAYVAGSWVLAVLTIANFAAHGTAGQVRFVAEGQDPNDVARFLDLAFPMAALVLHTQRRPWQRVLVLGYFPVGMISVLLTASRSGLLAGCVAIAGCMLLVQRRMIWAVLGALPLLVAGMWLVVPRGAITRIASIPEQLSSGDLNQRLNIWAAGWQAFKHAPLFGTGAGTFVDAAHVARIDTAHNTVLSIAVEGGLVGVALALVIVAVCVHSVHRAQGALRTALGTALASWILTSIAATVEGNRSTWFLFSLIAVAGRRVSGAPSRAFAIRPEACELRPGSTSIAEPSA